MNTASEHQTDGRGDEEARPSAGELRRLLIAHARARRVIVVDSVHARDRVPCVVVGAVVSLGAKYLVLHGGAGCGESVVPLAEVTAVSVAGSRQ